MDPEDLNPDDVEPNDELSAADGKYHQVRQYVAETPWAILPATFAAMLEVIALRAQGGRLSEDEIRERVGAGPARRPAQAKGAVAVIPLYGVIFPRASLFSQMSGGTSLQDFGAVLDEQVASSQISAILIDVHSPGGSTDLVAETAAKIRAARGAKPIVAIANTTAASAAYHLAAQADELVVTPSGLVGSIGVFAAHDDISRMQEMMGVKTTLIAAGKYKVEGNPFEPLSDEARAAIQARVDAMYGLFVRDVAAGRGVSERAVRRGFGQGRIVTAKDAVGQGMADRVDSFEATLARLLGGAPPSAAIQALDDLNAEELAQLEAEIASQREWAADMRSEIDAQPVLAGLRELTNDMRKVTT